MDRFRSRKLSLRLFVSAAAIIIAAFAAGTAAVAAEVSVPVGPLSPPAGANYYFIAEPVSLYADSYNLYAGGTSETYKFDLSGGNGTRVSDGADGYAVADGADFRLKDGVLYCEYGGSTAQVADGVGGIAADGNTLYAYKTAGGVYRYEVENGAAGGETLIVSDTVAAVAAANGRLYAAIRKNASVSSVCEITASGTVELDRQIYGAVKLTADGDTLFLLAGGSVVRYDDGTRITAAAPDVIDIAAANGWLYALTYAGSIVRWSDDLTGTTELVASASASDGFFDGPQSLATKKDTIAVADTGNDRVAVITDAVRYLDYTFSQPVAAAMDDYDNLYVAHAASRVEIFSADGTHTGTADGGGIRIRDMKINSLDEIVLRADDGLYTLKNGVFTRIYAGRVEAIAFMPNGGDLYALSDGKIYAVAFDDVADSGTLTEVAEVAAAAGDFALDIERSLYVAADGKVYKYVATDAGYTLADTAVPETNSPYVSDDVRITLSTIYTGLVDYGDILLTDTFASAVWKIDGATLGVTMIDDVPPPENTGDTAVTGTVSAVYEISEAVELYEYPRDMSPLYTLPAGTDILVVADTIDGAPAYAYVVAEHEVDGSMTLVSGYVRKLRLKDADNLPYTPPVKDTASVQNDGAKFYKYPSLYAPVLSAYENVSKDTAVTLLDFAEAYRDCNGGRWYRIEVEGGSAYIPAYNVTVNNYIPNGIRPQYNAVIIEYEGKTAADTFVLSDDGTYSVLNEDALPAGTRVEVVGAFDPSGEYTHIRHYDETLGGTLDCYVLTVHIDYQGVNAVQIIAVVLIIVTIVAAVILFIWRYRVKHKITG